MKKYITACVSLCLCLCLCFTLIACNSTTEPSKSPSPTPDNSGDASPSPAVAPTLAPNDPVLQIGDYILDGVDFNYYYYSLASDTAWEQYGVDLSQPLDTQFTPDESQTQTWDAFFREYAMQQLEYITPMFLEAKALGMVLSAEKQTQYDEELAWLERQCPEGQTLDEYLVTIFHEGMNEERMLRIIERQLLGTQLEEEQMGQEFPEEELRAYYEKNVAEEEWVTGYSVVVRHILLATEEEAQTVYDEWLAGDKTEESFATLATQHTTDTYSQQAGGLYEDVQQTEMVAEFDAWCFDQARQPGDTAVVKTEFGGHVMYFVGEGTEPWLIAAKQNKITEVMQEYTINLRNKYPSTRLAYQSES